MITKFKKMISSMLCMVLLCTLIAVPVSATTPTYIINENFEGDNPVFIGDNSSVYDFGGRHGKVMKLNSSASEDLMSDYTVNIQGADSNPPTIFRADVYVENASTPVVIRGMNADGGQSFAYKLYNNGIWNNTDQSALSGYTYKVGDWNSIVMYKRYNVKNDGTRNYHMHVYVNGICVVTALNKVTDITTLQIGTLANNAGANAYVDNVQVFSSAESGTFTATAAYEDGKIYVQTSMLTSGAQTWTTDTYNAANFTGTKLYKGDTEIGSIIVSQTTDTLVMQASSGLTAGETYKVKLPETFEAKRFDSGVAQNLNGAEISFIVPEEGTEEDTNTISYIIDEDFEGEAPNFIGNNSSVYNFGGRHGNVMKLNNGSEVHRINPMDVSVTGANDNSVPTCIFSADVYVESTDIPVVFDARNSSGGRAFALKLYDGKIYTGEEFLASEKTAESGTARGVTYEAGKWNNIMIYRRWNSNGNVHLYVNGALVNAHAEKVTDIASVRIATVKNDITDASAYVDDVEMFFHQDGAFYADAYAEDGQIAVETSMLTSSALTWVGDESPTAFTGTKLYNAAGNDITGSITQTNQKVVITPSVELELWEEYTVVLPADLKSKQFDKDSALAIKSNTVRCVLPGIKGIKLTDADGAEITKNNLKANDVVYAKVEVSGDVEVPATIIIAQYNGGAMKAAVVEERTVSGDMSEPVSLIVTEEADLTLKAFIWDSVSGLRPLIDAVEY